MNFAEALGRLRAALSDPRSGRDNTLVRRLDLRELLHHFDRLDAEARAAHDATHRPPDSYLKVPVRGANLAEMLLDQPWHAQCEIIPHYMPRYPSPETKPEVQIRFNNGKEHPPFLRYSKGPAQGFFWDIYGEDFQSIELAIVALSRAPAPRNVSPITFTIPLRPVAPQYIE
ncbi:hypothetical protein [Cupriavidus sp. UYPR2.512]|uniref:hypothetical protein n=1 Tax=Cupriavidus sp. UYPR2.512 TaxID=1080187 RepID=UPI000361F4FE|nr:hypothetical protein [Cupriavidus sp. UYPR2.512]UIF90919.1 hypothetical protein KAF44_32555 [Cupriavidus necator]